MLNSPNFMFMLMLDPRDTRKAYIYLFAILFSYHCRDYLFDDELHCWRVGLADLGDAVVVEGLDAPQAEAV